MSKAENVIAAQPRSEFGDNASRRLRKSGFIPAVIYSRGKESTAIMLKNEEQIPAEGVPAFPLRNGVGEHTSP